MQADQRRALIIHNHVAGRPTAHRIVRQVAKRLQYLGWHVDVQSTRGRGHATDLASVAVQRQYPLVVAAGGDGTINETLQPLVGTATALGVLPVGTVNVWAGELGLPTEPAALADLLNTGERRPIDVGRIGARYFLLMASVGFDAAVVEGVKVGLKRRVGRWAYAVSIIQRAYGYQGTRIQLSMDGVDSQHTALMLVIGNSQRYAGALRITPNALIDDGELDVCIVPGERLLHSPRQILGVLTGSSYMRRSLVSQKAAHITIEAEPPMAVQVDGDFAGYTPLRIETAHRALQVVIPNQHTNRLFSDTVKFNHLADNATKNLEDSWCEAHVETRL